MPYPDFEIYSTAPWPFIKNRNRPKAEHRHSFTALCWCNAYIVPVGEDGEWLAHHNGRRLEMPSIMPVPMEHGV